jgi:hypothetical protein
LVDSNLKVVFTNANSAEAGYAAWVPRLLAAFGILPERLLALDAPTQLRRAIVPEPLFEQFYSAHPEMLRPFQEVASRIAGDVKPSAQPVYLSRRLLSSRQRPVIGEAMLEEVLRENGFAIAYPETMTLEDQIRLVNSHTDIFSSMGSAAHNVLFALNRPRLHLLASRDDIPANYFLCSVLAGAPTTFVNCLGAGGRITANDERISRREETFGNEDKKRPVDLDAGPQAVPQLVDMPSVIDYLDKQGFIRNGLRASLARRSQPPQRQYDEAWLYARLRKGAAKSGDLAAEIEAEAVQFAETSWPVCLMLARYYARARDAARTDAMANQFADLVAAEQDINRLAHYRGDVESMAPRIVRMCGPAAADRLVEVLADRFLIGSRRRGDGQRS